MNQSTTALYPVSRLDAMTDGIFAVAMTLLVLDVRLPEEFHPHDQKELLEALAGLWPKFFPYALSFLVLGLRWLSSVRVKSRQELIGSDYVKWWLAYMLLVTCVPFSTAVVGRFASFPAAVWLYAANTALLGAVALHMMRLLPDVEDLSRLRERNISQVMLILSSLVAAGVSFFAAGKALWAFLLCFLVGPIADYLYQRNAADRGEHGAAGQD